MVLDKPGLQFPSRQAVTYEDCMEKECVCPTTKTKWRGLYIPVSEGYNDNPEHNDRTTQARKVHKQEEVDPRQTSLFDM